MEIHKILINTKHNTSIKKSMDGEATTVVPPLSITFLDLGGRDSFVFGGKDENNKGGKEI